MTVLSAFEKLSKRFDLLSFHLSFFFFSSRRRHTRFKCDWSSDVCSSDLQKLANSLLHLAAGYAACAKPKIGSGGRVRFWVRWSWLPRPVRGVAITIGK